MLKFIDKISDWFLNVFYENKDILWYIICRKLMMLILIGMFVLLILNFEFCIEDKCLMCVDLKYFYCLWY